MIGVLALTIVVDQGPVAGRAAPRDLSAEAIVDAAREGSIGLVASALSRGADPNATAPYQLPESAGGDIVDATPLLVAVARNDVDLVRALLGLGVDFRRPANQAALCLAARLDLTQILTAFEESGVSPGWMCHDAGTGVMPAGPVP